MMNLWKSLQCEFLFLCALSTMAIFLREDIRRAHQAMDR